MSLLSHVFNVKIKKLLGGNLLHFRCLACCVVEFNYKGPFNTGLQCSIEMTISGTFQVSLSA